MRSNHPRRVDGDRGVAFIEFALVLPVLLLLVFAIFEFGFLWGSVNKVERSVQNAARTGSGQGNNRYADYEVLRAVESSLAGIDGATVSRVIVYASLQADGSVPPDCLSIAASGTAAKGISGLCNVYSPTQVASDNPGNFASPSAALDGCTAAAWDTNWCPSSRSRSLSSPSYLGVYVEVSYSGRTNIIPGTIDVQRRAVYQVEPCKAGESSC